MNKKAFVVPTLLLVIVLLVIFLLVAKSSNDVVEENTEEPTVVDEVKDVIEDVVNLNPDPTDGCEGITPAWHEYMYFCNKKSGYQVITEIGCGNKNDFVDCGEMNGCLTGYANNVYSRDGHIYFYERLSVTELKSNMCN